MHSLSAPLTEQDFIRLFELKSNWNKDDLRIAFRKLAKKYHPDANPGDREADARFKYVNHAYEELSRIADRPRETPADIAAKKAARVEAGHEMSDMASEELYEKLLHVVRHARTQNASQKPLTRFQKFMKWLSTPIGGSK
jgi:DnaJ-class molecular chaperone